MLSEEEAEILEDAYNALCRIDTLTRFEAHDFIHRSLMEAIKCIGAVRYPQYFEHLDWHPKYEVISINGIPTIEAKAIKYESA